MIYKILADAVVLLHLLFIIFVIGGGFLVLRRSWVALAHLPAVAWGIFVEFSGRICPLTPIENTLRRLASEQGYSTGFIRHYLHPIIYPTHLTREMQIVFGIAVITINLIFYFLFLLRFLRRFNKSGRPTRGERPLKSSRQS